MSLVRNNKEMVELYAGSEIAHITSAQFLGSKPAM